MVFEIELFESIYTKTLWMVTKKEKLLTGVYTVILISCLNDKFVTQKTHVLQSTINIQKSTVSLNELGNSCASLACFSSELIFTFLYAGSNIRNACQQFVSSVRLFFVNLTHHTTPQTKIWLRSRDSNSITSQPFRIKQKPLRTFFLTLAGSSPKILTLQPDSLCVTILFRLSSKLLSVSFVL